MEWLETVEIVESYIEINKEELGSIADVVKLQIRIGSENADERSRVISSIRGLLKGRANSPFRQGVRLTKPVSVKVTIDKVSKMVYEASIVYFNMVPSGLHLKHGKSGGGGYASAEEYAKVEEGKIKTVLHRRFKNKLWDGTLEGLGYETPTLIANEEKNL